jgi:hypothetical protein
VLIRLNIVLIRLNIVLIRLNIVLIRLNIVLIRLKIVLIRLNILLIRLNDVAPYNVYLHLLFRIACLQICGSSFFPFTKYTTPGTSPVTEFLFPFKHTVFIQYIFLHRFQWPRGLRRGSAAVRFLRLQAWMSVSCDCCVLLGRVLCIELITRPGGFLPSVVCLIMILTLNLLTTTIVAPPSNASKWQLGLIRRLKV